MKRIKVELINPDEAVAIFNHTFAGRDDLRNCVEVYASPVELPNDRFYEPYRPALKDVGYASGVHVLYVCKRFPCFDASDYMNETRCFGNFYFTLKAISDEEVEKYCRLKFEWSYDRLPEEFPLWAAPALLIVGRSQLALVTVVDE